MDRIRIEYMATDRLIPYVNNPRKNDKAVDVVAGSIQEFGFKNPIIVDRDNVIVAGHTRLLAARKLELEEVPVIRAEDLTEQQIKAFRLADNKTAEFAEWDMELLALELEGLDDIFTGFNEVEIADILGLDNEAQEDDFDADAEAEKIIEPETKPGDVWLLGRHRLMCGDATKKEDVERLMDGKKADMVFTDPPYGVNVKGGKGKGNTIAGDLTQTAIPFSFEICVKQATKDKARFYFCGGEGNIGLYFKLFERYLAQMPKLLIWVKNGFVLKQNGYHNQYELIFYGFKAGGGGKEYWYSGRTEDEASDVWRVSRDASTSYLHPTQKPIELPARAIRNSSKAGDTIFDPFGGSGSTLIACEQLNRACYTMELDPVYVDVIKNRWEHLTGLKAEKTDQGQTA
jgi:DNA modification methylase